MNIPTIFTVCGALYMGAGLFLLARRLLWDMGEFFASLEVRLLVHVVGISQTALLIAFGVLIMIPIYMVAWPLRVCRDAIKIKIERDDDDPR